MPYHSHKLNSTHSHIIERKDPITGDSVQENDSVVFCAACQSCFLEESWIYMNEKHCEQNQTLENVPVLPSKLVAKKTKEEVIAELSNKGINFHIVIPIMTLTFLFSFFCLGFTEFGKNLEKTLISVTILSFLVGFVSSFITLNRKVKKIVGDDKNDVRLFKNRLEIGKETFLWNDIEQIKYQREMYVNETDNARQNLSRTPFLLIYFRNKTFIKRNLTTKSHKKTEKLLVGLEKISHFKEVFFYSENPKELEVMRNIKYRSKGNIEIGNPRKLLNYNTFW